MRKILSTLLLLLMTAGMHSIAQTIAFWNPSGVSGYGPSPWAATTTAANVTVGGLTRVGAGTSGTAAGNAWGGNNWHGSGTYAAFTISANGGYKVSLSAFNLRYRRSGTGPASGTLQYSLNGSSFTNISTLSYSSTSSSGATLPTVNLSGIAALQNVPCNTTIYFRILNSGGGSSGTWYVFGSGLTVSGSVSSYPAPSVGTDPATATIPAASGTSFTVSGVSGAASYQWQRNISGISGGTWVNISSATLDPTGTYSGYTTTSSATSNTLTLSNVPASWNGYGYRCVVTNCSGSTNSGGALLNVSSGACSGTPAAGAAVPSTASFCNSGSTTLTLTGGSTGTGLTYQWSESITDAAPGTPIAGATNSTYTTPVLTDTTYYWCTTTCSASGSSDISTTGMVAIKPLPTISATGGDVCAGGTGISVTASGAATYTWAPTTGLSAATGATVTANPAATTVYTITGTDAAGCTNTTTATVNYLLAPGMLSITPTSVTACLGDATQVIKGIGGMVGPTTISSGTITIPASISASGTITTSLDMAGIPAGAVITGASVNLISFGSQYQDDYVVNIKAPNGNILNLIDQRGSHTSTVTTLFANTNLSSTGSTSLGSGSGTFTGTWMADASNAVGGAPYTSNVTNWSGLFSTPNGTWTLSIFNNTSFTNTVVSNMSWSVTLDYAYQTPIVWSPTTDLYDDAAATIPYSGSAVDSVFFNPASTGVPVTYTATASNGTCVSTATVTPTVNTLPGTINGADTVCIGATVFLTNASTTGTWSGSNANVIVSSSTGSVTGNTAGTSVISYVLPTGCYTTMIVTVNALPVAIAGPTTVCTGATITLTDGTTGGTWSSSTANVSADVSTGVVTGNIAGISDISYTLSTGCYTTHEVTVNQTPYSIGGPSDVCTGSDITLTNAVPGGTWSSDNGNVTVDASTGIVSGVTAGTSVLSYVMGTGCYATTTITVNALPATITGIGNVCENGGTVDLDNATSGGTWTSNNTNVTIDASTGVVTGAAAGTSTVSYTLATGCYTTTIVTIDAAPAVITGTLSVCETGTTTLANATGTGTWSSSSLNASVAATTGIVTGATAGTATISYTIPSGCFSTAEVTVNQTPATIAGLSSVCNGSSIALSSTPTGGTWSTDNSNISVDGSGTATGMAVGTTMVSYTLSTGCYNTRTLSVDALPATIGGPMEVCQSSSITLSNATSGGTWNSDNTAIATIDNTSGVLNGSTAGTAGITYTLTSTGCQSSTTITVNSLPAPISGLLSVCIGSTVPFSNTTIGGVWSSDAAAIADVDATGNVTGMSSGTAHISYTLPTTGCYATVITTVSSTPSAILGSHAVCVGATTALTNPLAGGTWSSSNPTVGSVNSTTGVVSGIAPGTTSITYGLLSGCTITTTVTVNNLPPASTGTAEICAYATTMLLNTATGGTWSTGNPAIANVTSTTGIVNGLAAGTATITYTTGTGCYSTTVVTINALPAPITGVFSVCEGNTTALNSTTSSGLWVSDNTTIATVNTVTGEVSGLANGITYITYTMPTGCATHATITVNATPAAIVGSSNVCLGSSVAFTDATTGGTWSSSNTSVATVSSTGGVFGSSVGAAVITYKLPNGCLTTSATSVQPTPTAYAVTGGGNFCSGGTGVNVGLSASQTGVDYTLYTGTTSAGPVSGTGTAITFGLQTAAGIYTVLATDATTGCSKNMSGSAIVVVQALVVPSVTISTTATDDTSCSGATVTFNSLPVNGGTSPAYSWLVNGAFMASGNTYTYTPANGDVVSVKMASNIACRTADTVTAAVTRLVLPSLHPAVAMSVSPNDTVCDNTDVVFTAAATAGGSTSYAWTVNGLSVAGTGAVFTLTPNNNDRIKCIITSSYRCRTADTAHSQEVKMTVLPMLTPTVVIDVTPGLTIAAGTSCTMTATVFNGGATPTYQWSVNGSTIAGATNASFVSSTLQNADEVTCMVTSSGMCGGFNASNTVVMTVLNPGNVVATATASDLRLIPNPNNGSFSIAGLTTEDAMVTITDMMGRKVFENILNAATNTKVNINSTIADGMYIVTVRTAAGISSLNLVVKR